MRQMMTMMQATPLPLDALGRVDVSLGEWDRAGPDKVPGLAKIRLSGEPKLRKAALALRSKIDLQEGLNGLQIVTSSFVGRLDLGPLRISINPKLPGLPLGKLVRYAYGLRDLTTFEESSAPTSHLGLHDLLISLLASEVEELARRGLARLYIPKTSNLERPRGRILVNELARQGGVTQARLPCLHVERHSDWHLNQVLLAGLRLAAQMADDPLLRRRVHRVSGLFGDVLPTSRLRLRDVVSAQRALTRLTSASYGALTLISLLLEDQGLGFDSQGSESPVRGFLFDMNLFFQRLLSRFLHENLVGAHVADEQTIRSLYSWPVGANPRNRATPRPRPDIALYRGSALSSFLDAKYRDLWQRSLPREWLYQMSIYALASPSNVSVLLYASTSVGGCDECVQINHPVTGTANGLASVILRPVPLIRLAEMLASGPSMFDARQHLAAGLVKLTT